MAELVASPIDLKEAWPSCSVDRLAELSKRTFDLAVAAAALIVLAPVFLLIAVLIKLDSRGPVFFRQVRVGRDRRHFRMWKFRKMFDNLPTQGPNLTRRFDARLTRVGKLLERTKLDELPQFFNVLAGDMSIVGPRPEIPSFVAHYPKQWDRVLSVKPGIFGPCQVLFRNESELYPPGCTNLERHYVGHILPRKLAIDAAYASSRSLVGDMVTLVRAVLKCLSGIVTRETLINRRWQILNTVVLSLAGFVGTFVMVRLLGHGLSANVAWWILLFSALAKPACVIAFKIPKALATSVTADDLMRCCWCAAVSSSLLVCGGILVGFRDLSRLMLLADAVLFLTLLILYKLICHNIYSCFFRPKVWGTWQPLVLSSLVVGPLSMALVLGVRFLVDVLRDKTPSALPGLVLLALAIRPAVLLFMPIPSHFRSNAWPWHVWWKLLLGSLVGSALMVSAALLLNDRSLGRLDMFCDGAFYTILMSAIAYRSQTRSRQSDSSRGTKIAEPKERLLLIGEGAELGSYVSALTALPEHRFEVVGALCTQHGYRSNMAGGVAVLGELHDAPEIVGVMGVTRVVVLDTDISEDALDKLRSSCSLDHEQIVKVEVLSPLMRL